MLERVVTDKLIMYVGPRKDIKNKIGELWFYLDGKSNYVKWAIKPIEGLEREPIFINPVNVSFLEPKEIERLKLRLSSTNIRANHKKEELKYDRMRRHNDVVD